MGRHCHETVATGTGHRRAGARTLQPIDRLSRCHGHDSGLIAGDLLSETVGVLSGGEADHLEAISVCVDDRERALPNRAGRAENGDAFHLIVHRYFSTT